MELPNIGRSGSIVSILVPGTFLLLNIIIGFYYLFLIEDIPPQRIQTFLEDSSGALSIIVFLLLVCIGYLLGVILRLVKCDITDNLSGWYLKYIEYRIYRFYIRNIERPTYKFYFKYIKRPIYYYFLKYIARHFSMAMNIFGGRKAFKKLRNRKRYKIVLPFKNEIFPYIKWLGMRCKKEYPEAKEFYYRTWGKKRDSSNRRLRRRKSFLNFCKVILKSKNDNLANECYAAEALNRYLSSMFYGIGLSFIIVLLVLFKYFVKTNNKLFLIFLVVESLYAWSEWLIIRNYRFIRMKEVETVFAATYSIRESFE